MFCQALLNVTLPELQGQQLACRRCPRLIEWCDEAANNPPARFRGQTYHNGPVSSWGDASARLLIVGLAPAANGANRTGRLFTGDKSGEWLFRALHKAGFASQPDSTHKDDGLELRDCLISCAVRCAPPDNKPLPTELRACRPFLLDELRLLTELRVVVGLGKIGFDCAFDSLKEAGLSSLKARPKFAHGAQFEVAPKLWLVGSFHPSQQNTFTKRLTEPMFDSVFARANEILNDKCQANESSF
jgi:uracil-DNA glycosylase family 4